MSGFSDAKTRFLAKVGNAFPIFPWNAFQPRSNRVPTSSQLRSERERSVRLFLSSTVYYQSYEFNTVLEVKGMSFMVGKSSPKPSLKLHLLWLGMQPLYQDVQICDLAL